MKYLNDRGSYDAFENSVDYNEALGEQFCYSDITDLVNSETILIVILDIAKNCFGIACPKCSNCLCVP